MKNVPSFILSVLLGLVLGCGGGGGGGGGGDSTGSVAFLVKDAPFRGLTALEVTIERVELLGDPGPFVLFEGSRRVNLLEFDDMEFLLALRDDVPAGNYEKIRLRVTDPAIAPNPSNFPVSISGNGKLDLNPKGTFTVSPGRTLAIRIDFDANNAVHVILTGNQHYKVRPVIFVKIEEEFAPIPLRDFSGVVLDRDLAAGTLRVDADNGVGEVTVLTNLDTTVFDTDVAEANLDVIEVGDRVLVRGRLQSAGTVLAELIFEGDPLRLQGTLPDGSDPDPFPFDVDPNQGAQGTLDTTFVEGARSFVFDGPEIPFADLAPGIRGVLTGRFFAVDDLFRVGLIDIEIEMISGVIEMLDLGADPPTIGVRDGDNVLATVALDDDTVVRLTGDGFVSPAELSVGLDVEVDISGAINGIRRAEEIRVEPLSFSGEVLVVDTANRELLLRPEGGSPDVLLQVAADATILEVTSQGSAPIELDEVEVGDEATALGLPDANAGISISVLIVFPG